MEKSKINMLVILFLLIFICSLTYFTFSQTNIIMVDGVKFTVPAGYHEADSVAGDI